MASFSEEIREAAKGLQAFNASLRSATGGGAAGGLSGGLGSVVGGTSGGRGFLAAGGPAGLALAAAGVAADAVAAGARFLTPAASAFAVTGSSQAFASAVSKSVLGAVQDTSIGALILGATGVSAAADTNQRAGGSVLSTTEDLARIGVGVSDKQRRQLFSIAQEQEKRVTEERGKVNAIADSAEALGGAKPAGAGAGFDDVVDVLRSIESFVKNFTSGGS